MAHQIDCGVDHEIGTVSVHSVDGRGEKVGTVDVPDVVRCLEAGLPMMDSGSNPARPNRRAPGLKFANISARLRFQQIESLLPIGDSP